MKSLFSFVEGLKIGSHTNIRKQIFTDDELRKDYKDVEYAITKAEKQQYANKYRLNTNRFRDIQIAILNHLRNNRNNKNVATIIEINLLIIYYFLFFFDLPACFSVTNACTGWWSESVFTSRLS